MTAVPKAVSLAAYLVVYSADMWVLCSAGWKAVMSAGMWGLVSVAHLAVKSAVRKAVMLAHCWVDKWAEKRA